MHFFKKVLFFLAALSLFIVFYYMTQSSQKINSKVQEELHIQLKKLQNYGFNISKRKKEERKEHFVISIADVKKASNFLQKKGLQVTIDDAEQIKGFQLGIDLFYEKNSIALDLYPIALSKQFNAKLLKNNKLNLLKQIETLLKKKALLIHFSLSHTGKIFKGYIKDIDENITDDQNFSFMIKDYYFKGKLEKEKISSLTQNSSQILFHKSNHFTFNLLNTESNYTSAGSTVDDFQSSYQIEKLTFSTNNELNIIAEKIILHSDSNRSHTLISQIVQNNINKISFTHGLDHLVLHQFILESEVKNLDLHAFEKLQNIDLDNEKLFYATLQRLISNNPNLSITKLSTDDITLNNESIDGFDISASLDIDKSLRIKDLKHNPLLALDTIDASISASLSKELLSFIKKQPEAMITLMILRPKKSLGRRIFTIKLKDGSLNINGMSIL